MSDILDRLKESQYMQQTSVIEAEEKKKSGYDEPIVKVLAGIRNELHEINKHLKIMERRK